jgi:hypothetical protein
LIWLSETNPKMMANSEPRPRTKKKNELTKEAMARPLVPPAPGSP